MYVKVRTMDGVQTTVLTISKLTTVEDFRILVNDKFGAPPERQRLFFRGKQMEDGYTLFDYSVNINDVIQLMIKPVFQELTNTSKKSPKKKSTQSESGKENDTEKKDKEEQLSKYYKVGDLVDARYLYDGSWWEAQIIKISNNPYIQKGSKMDDGLLYYVKFEGYHHIPEDQVKLQHIRPRARTKISLNDISPDDLIMVNYNIENPEERGFWYNFKVKNILNTRKNKVAIGTIYVADNNPVEDCHVTLVDELFKIEPHILLTDRDKPLNDVANSPSKRKSGPFCSHCKDNQKRKCKECGCSSCGGKENPDKQLMCDECDQPYHIYCLDPPLESIPEVDEWYCPLCKNDETEIVKAGEKLKASKKKEKMASSKNSTSRDWGKGFACAGRQKVCSIVPQNHFGPVPGVEVGTMWKYRLQASEAGIHRPHVAGIHGRENEGAYSIVLAGGYEDDEDNGDEFTYTGSGGRDLSGNKRTAEQSSDQLLTRMNKALALNCKAPLNKSGTEAVDWKAGKPVRVIRSFKGRKHSDYAPEEGIRYDGIYKIVKYWQAPGISGHKVWRYLLKRDDPSPAPWTEEGKKRIKELGLVLQYPDGYLEALGNKSKNSQSDSEEEEEKPKRGRKRKSSVTPKTSIFESSAKKSKSCEYKIEEDIQKLIDIDTLNEKIWRDCCGKTAEGKQKFLSMVEEKFECVCCQSVVNKPVTTPCQHNVCESCIDRSFKASLYVCPACRYDLGSKYKMTINENLSKVLLALFPGYDCGR